MAWGKIPVVHIVVMGGHPCILFHSSSLVSVKMLLLLEEQNHHVSLDFGAALLIYNIYFPKLGQILVLDLLPVLTEDTGTEKGRKNTCSHT